MQENRVTPKVELIMFLLDSFTDLFLRPSSHLWYETILFHSFAAYFVKEQVRSTVCFVDSFNWMRASYNQGQSSWFWIFFYKFLYSRTRLLSPWIPYFLQFYRTICISELCALLPLRSSNCDYRRIHHKWVYFTNRGT